MKFGGAGLADGPAVRRACELVAAEAAAEPVVVVSAHEGVTRALEKCAQRAASGRVELEEVRLRHKGLLRQLRLDSELLDRLLGELGQVLRGVAQRGHIQPGELDFVLSMGERLSARVVAASLRATGVAATPVDAFDLGLTTDSCHGHARPLPGVEASLRRSLEEVPGTPVVTGFLAADGGGNLTTLGRNGSDLTAALVAQALGATRLVFWKTVPGLLEADPELVPEARIVDELSMAEAEALAFHGASVLHPATLEPLHAGQTELQLRDVGCPELPGTRIERRAPGKAPLAIAGHRELVGFRVEGEGASAHLFALMHAHHVRPRLLRVTARGVVVHCPPSPGFELLRRELSECGELLPTSSSVVLVGGGGSGFAHAALERLLEAGIVPRHADLESGGLWQLFLLDPAQRPEATRRLHALLREVTARRRSRSST